MIKTSTGPLFIGILLSVLVCAPLLFAQQPVATAPVTPLEEAQYDEEHIVDVRKLKDSTIESLRTIEERLEKVQLKGRFEEVFRVLEQDEIDNAELKTALENLETGVDEFRDDWDTTIEPLWKGHEMVGDTISKVRSILAASQEDGEVHSKQQKDLRLYEERLKVLSQEIISEPDPKRKLRLKLLFKNLYNLKQIKKSRVNLSPASQLVLSKMIDALEHLEIQFTRIIFTAEESYAVLGNQQQFLNDYIQVVKGLVDIEDLASWFAKGGTEESIATVEGLITQFEGLNVSITDFEDAMGKYSGKMIGSIEEHSQRIENNLKSMEAKTYIDRELDNIIDEYAGKEGQNE